MLSKKTIRYYYWLLLEFLKKHLRVVLMSMIGSFIMVVSFISFSPYIQTHVLSKKEAIGIIGKYDLNTLPEEITQKISNGLLFINNKGDLSPALAASWESTNQGKEYRFHMRDGLMWGNGKPFKSSDINYQFKDVERKIIDDKTIHFILKKPLPIFPTYLNKPLIRPPLVGVAGIYKVAKIVNKFDYVSEISLTPNKKDLQPITYKFYTNEQAMINAYKLGEINRMVIGKKSVADVFRKWNNTIVTQEIDYNKLMTLFFNFKNKLMSEKEVRQAIYMSIDPSIFNELGSPALGPVSPASWAFNPNNKPQIFDHDGAEKILKKFISASDSANLKFYTFYDYLNEASAITQALKDVGMNVKLELLSTERPESFDILLAYWNIPIDPDQYFFWHSTQTQGNLGGYKNVKVDKLLEDGRGTQSTEERKRIYFDFQKIVADDPPALFLYFPYVYTIKRK